MTPGLCVCVRSLETAGFDFITHLTCEVGESKVQTRSERPQLGSEYHHPARSQQRLRQLGGTLSKQRVGVVHISFLRQDYVRLSGISEERGATSNISVRYTRVGCLHAVDGARESTGQRGKSGKKLSAATETDPSVVPCGGIGNVSASHRGQLCT